jgi:hypothetical protein
MKFFFLFFCALILSIDSIYCFKPADFCKKERFLHKCKAYNCGTKFCSFNKKSCDDLISWENLVKNPKEPKKLKEPKVYQIFIFHIKICKKRELKNQW